MPKPVDLRDAEIELNMGLRELIQLLRERVWMIVGLGVIGAAAGFGIGSVLPRSFHADGLLIVDTQEINIPEFQTIRSQGTVEPWGARSAARVLVSREIVDNAARTLNLENDPDFNPVPWSKSIENALPDWVRQRIAASGIGDPIGGSPPNDPADWANLVDSIRHDLYASSEERSYAITLGFTGHNPEVAAQIVNAVMDEFIKQERDAKRRTLTAASVQLQQESKKLSAALEVAWAKIRSLEGRSSTVATMVGTVAAQKLVALAQEEQNVDNELARINADLGQVEVARREGRANLLNPNLVTPRLKAMLTNEASLREKSAEIAVRVGAEHPQMRAMKMQLDRVSADIAGEMTAILSSLQQRLANLQERRKTLRADVDKNARAAGVSAGDRAELEQLRTDAQSRQQLYETYQKRYYQTLANLEIIQPSTRIASRAAPPTHPSSPGRGLLAAIAASAGVLLALAGILGRRWLADRIETLPQVGVATGLPVLGGIPWVNGGLFRPKALAPNYALHQRKGLITETVRGILLQVRSVDGPTPKVIMIASPQAGDGKTSLSLYMARVAARDMLRTLCIDADFRRPALGNRAGISPYWFLNDVLDGTVDLDQAITQDPASEAHILAARPVEGDPLSLLDADRLASFFDLVRAQYDLVIVDTPPVLRVIDPLLIAPLADAVVLVVSQGSSTREMVAETVQRLLRARARIAGAVMARLNGRVPEEYVYAGYGRQ